MVQVKACFNSGSCISEGDTDIFGTMSSVWQLFYYFPKKTEALKGIQAVLGFPELKILKPSDTRWLSHERCVNNLEGTASIVTNPFTHKSSGDAGHMVYTPIWQVIMVHHAVISYQKFSVPLLSRGGGGGLYLKSPKFGHIFVAVITFFPILLCRHFCKL